MAKKNQYDVMLETLQEEIAKREEDLKELQNSKGKWITNGKYLLSNGREIAIKTASVDDVLTSLRDIEVKKIANKEVLTQIGREYLKQLERNAFGSFTSDNYIADFKLRLLSDMVSKRRERLDKLRDEAHSLMSPEQQRAAALKKLQERLEADDS